MNDLMMGIPAVDLADWMSGDETRRQKFVKELGHAYENIGFVAVKNHLIDDETVEKLYREVKRFFDLPLEIKQKYEDPNIAGQRGYTSFGKEHAKDSNAGDLKEFWHFGQEVQGNDPIRDEYAENIFVDELPEFNEVGLKAYRDLENTGREMLRAIALHLSL
ncbi:MAG: hypothetical protein RL226_1583, partial [Bacteroidota bacterium]